MPRKEKIDMIVRDHAELSIRSQCDLLKLHRSGLYYQPSPKSNGATLMNEIYELWIKRPFYGYRRITKTLQRNGYNINHKHVLRLMREMNLQAIYPKKRTTYVNRDHKKYPYLLRNLVIKGPNHVWATDITYILMPDGYVYLVAMIDLYSRYIVAWELSNCLDAEFCISMLERGLCVDKPKIINTDQGVQFTSHAWIDTVQSNDILPSMDGVGRCMDNIFIERFWRSLKQENVYRLEYNDVPHARKEIGQYIDFYNNERLHSSLGYKTPAEVYFDKTSDYLLVEKEKENCVVQPPLV